MKTTSNMAHLSRSEITGLVQNKLLNGERTQAINHLKECELCSEAYEGLKRMPDMSSLYTLNAKWKLKTGGKSSRPFSVNLSGAYAVLILTGLISIAVLYFFFFIPSKKPLKKFKETAPIQQSAGNAEHFIITDKINVKDTVEEFQALQPEIKEGIYDEIKKPGEAIEKLEPVGVLKNIPEATLGIIKGNSKQNLLNIEGYKIIDYSNDYKKDEDLLKSFNEGLGARYESPEMKSRYEKDDAKRTIALTYEQAIAEGLRCLKDDKWNEAAGMFNFMLDYFPRDLNCIFYKALSYEKAGLYNKAIDELKPLMQNNNHTFYEEAKWHSALCYKMIGDDKTGRRLLHEIINEGGFYSQQAKMFNTPLSTQQ